MAANLVPGAVRRHRQGLYLASPDLRGQAIDHVRWPADVGLLQDQRPLVAPQRVPAEEVVEALELGVEPADAVERVADLQAAFGGPLSAGDDDLLDGRGGRARRAAAEVGGHDPHAERLPLVRAAGGALAVGLAVGLDRGAAVRGHAAREVVLPPALSGGEPPDGDDLSASGTLIVVSRAWAAGGSRAAVRATAVRTPR